MIIINMHEAKTHFSKLVNTVMQGEEVIIAKAGKPAAKLVPIVPVNSKRVPGKLKEKIQIADDFDAPLPNDFLNQFEEKN
jgi:prevent-host-death family protein